MNDSDGKGATRLLDPRFEYTPAAQTNVAATWKRFGFDPQANEQRRRLVLRSFGWPSDKFALAPSGVVVFNG